jgi:hypothetical protein
VARPPGTRSPSCAPTHRRSSEPRPPERWRNSAWHPHSAQRRQPSGVQTSCKRFGPSQQTFCKRPTVETPRNRAKRLTRSPVFSGFLAHVRCVSRNMNLSGRQDLNLRPPGPQPEGWGVAQVIEPVFAGFFASEFSSVSLNLFPKLFPKHMFVSVRRGSVRVNRKITPADKTAATSNAHLVGMTPCRRAPSPWRIRAADRPARSPSRGRRIHIHARGREAHGAQTAL